MGGRVKGYMRYKEEKGLGRVDMGGVKGNREVGEAKEKEKSLKQLQSAIMIFKTWYAILIEISALFQYITKQKLIHIIQEKHGSYFPT